MNRTMKTLTALAAAGAIGLTGAAAASAATPANPVANPVDGQSVGSSKVMSATFKMNTKAMADMVLIDPDQPDGGDVKGKLFGEGMGMQRLEKKTFTAGDTFSVGATVCDQKDMKNMYTCGDNAKLTFIEFSDPWIGRPDVTIDGRQGDFSVGTKVVYQANGYTWTVVRAPDTSTINFDIGISK